MNSHIQMPRCIIKNFENSANELYYINIEEKNCEIKKGHSKTLYTEENYYSESVETFLDKKVESPFGEIAKFIKEVDLNSTFTLPKDFKERTHQFVAHLIYRGKRLQEEINKNSVFFQFFSDFDKHNIPIILAQNNDTIDKLLSQYEYTIAFNSTMIPFVLPTYGLIAFGLSSYSAFLLPITPERAICLVHKDGLRLLIKNGRINILLFNDNNKVKQINNYAYEHLKNNKYGCLISNNKSELQRILTE